MSTPPTPPHPTPPPEPRWDASRLSGERRFFAGPQSRLAELWWAIQVFVEFIRGFRALHFVGPCVTVFGSARFAEGHPYYTLTREVGAELAREGFIVMTGGGPGLMEAANRGARDAGGRSIGCNIQLPLEQQPNPYLDVWLEFRHFFVRKVVLVKYSYAFIVMPGGFGTLDEAFEAATLVQTGKIEEFPIVFMGTEFWAPIREQLYSQMVPAGTITQAEADRVLFTDSPQEAAAAIQQRALSRFGLRYGPRVRPRRRFWLFE